jgi:hypothetical protein
MIPTTILKLTHNLSYFEQKDKVELGLQKTEFMGGNAVACSISFEFSRYSANALKDMLGKIGKQFQMELHRLETESRIDSRIDYSTDSLRRFTDPERILQGKFKVGGDVVDPNTTPISSLGGKFVTLEHGFFLGFAEGRIGGSMLPIAGSSQTQSSSQTRLLVPPKIPALHALVKYDPLAKSNLDFLRELGDIMGLALWPFVNLINEIRNTSIDRSYIKCYRCHKQGHHAQECQGPTPDDRSRYEQVKDFRELLRWMQIAPSNDEPPSKYFQEYLPGVFEGEEGYVSDRNAQSILARMQLDLNELHHAVYLHDPTNKRVGVNMYSAARVKPFAADAKILVDLAAGEVTRILEQREFHDLDDSRAVVLLRTAEESLERAQQALEDWNHSFSESFKIVDRQRKLSRFVPDAALPDLMTGVLQGLMTQLRSPDGIELSRDLYRLLLPRMNVLPSGAGGGGGENVDASTSVGSENENESTEDWVLGMLKAIEPKTEALMQVEQEVIRYQTQTEKEGSNNPLEQHASDASVRGGEERLRVVLFELTTTQDPGEDREWVSKISSLLQTKVNIMGGSLLFVKEAAAYTSATDAKHHGLGVFTLADTAAAFDALKFPAAALVKYFGVGTHIKFIGLEESKRSTRGQATICGIRSSANYNQVRGALVRGIEQPLGGLIQRDGPEGKTVPYIRVHTGDGPVASHLRINVSMHECQRSAGLLFNRADHPALCAALVYRAVHRKQCRYDWMWNDIGSNLRYVPATGGE